MPEMTLGATGSHTDSVFQPLWIKFRKSFVYQLCLHYQLNTYFGIVT